MLLSWTDECCYRLCKPQHLNATNFGKPLNMSKSSENQKQNPQTSSHKKNAKKQKPQPVIPHDISNSTEPVNVTVHGNSQNFLT